MDARINVAPTGSRIEIEPSGRISVARTSSNVQRSSRRDLIHRYVRAMEHDFGGAGAYGQ